MSGSAKLAVCAGAMMLGALVIAVLTNCAPLKVGPFIPPNPVACSSDAACPEHMHCGFPSVDSRSICLDGDSDIDAPPELGAKRRALNCIVEDDAGERRYAHCGDAGAP